MSSPYFISVDPSPAKLLMFFGRRREIQKIFDYLQNGDSVLLIGERRMGKTFLLYMIGDFAGVGVDFYEDLLDLQTGACLAELHRATASYCWAFVDMLTITSASGFYFNILAKIAEEQVERFVALSPIDHTSFANELIRLSKDLSCAGQRAVVLVDESQKLLNMDESANTLSCLKAAIQRCDAVEFVLAGDIKPHQETPEFMNLKGALRLIYLPPLDSAGAKALVRIPMEGRLSFEDSALERILELTGGKPSLIQILCGYLYEMVTLEDGSESHITQADIDHLWESGLRDKVFESFEVALKDFFEGLQGNEQSVFCFLAHNPLATVDDIVKALGIQSTLAQRAVYTLHRTNRIEKAESGFRISAKIVEEFGARFVACPVLDVESLEVRDSQAGEVGTLQDIILQDENAVLEFKSSMRWDYHRKAVHKDIEEAFIKTVAAFLNTDGGTLVIGVDDEGQVLGLTKDYHTFHKKNRDGFELHLMRLISDNLGKNVCRYIHPTFYTIDRFEVCKVEVEVCPRPVYASKEAIFYIRTGNQTQKLNPMEAVEYIKHRWDKL